MVMRVFRAQTKWVFYILVVSFVGWLALSQVMDYLGSSERVALEVNGHKITTQQFELAVRRLEEQYRAQTGRMPSTRDERRDLENQVAEQMIQGLILGDEYERLRIEVRKEELLAAMRSSPPPDVMERTEFQTDGQFDLEKWQRFLETADPQVQLALEQSYREMIPQGKLQQYLTADVYLSDARLWRAYRDQRDSIRVALLPLWPDALPDTGVSVTDAELRRYLSEHEDQYRRPAMAYLSYVALDRRPNAADTAAARARVAEVRAEALRDRATFERLAGEVSADSVTRARGGDLGWFKRTAPGFVPQFLSAVRALRPGQVSPPVLTEMGYEIVRLEEARGDSVRARRIVVPVELAGEHLDDVEGRADSLDQIAAGQLTGEPLDSAAALLGVPVAQARPLAEGDRLMLGPFVIPDVSVWAFESAVGETSPVIEGQVAYYVFRLDSLHAAGVPDVAQIRDALTEAVRREKKKTLVGDRARALAEQVRAAPSLADLGGRLGLSVQTLGPFTRVNPPSLLQREPVVLGAAFGLAAGETSGPIAGEQGYYFVEVLSRKTADSTGWAAQKETQRANLLATARQQRVSQYMNDLRKGAEIVDRRQELMRQAAQGSGQAPPPVF